MSREVKDVRNAIRDLQIERRKIDETLKEANSILEYVTRELKVVYVSHSKGVAIHTREEVHRYIGNVESKLRVMIKNVKGLKKAQNYPLKDLVKAVKKITEGSQQEDPAPLFVLRQDIKIQEYIELRTLSLNNLFIRLMAYIKIKKEHLEAGIYGLSKGEKAYREFRDDFGKAIRQIIVYIMSELEKEQEMIETEIKGLSDEIEKLE